MGSDVKSTCVCPYFVDTGMFDGAKSNVLPFLRSEVAVEETMAAILLDKELVLLPWTTNLLIIVKS
jgi:short-subunit dehydrogenase